MILREVEADAVGAVRAELGARRDRDSSLHAQRTDEVVLGAEQAARGRGHNLIEPAQHLVGAHQLLRLDAGVVARGLRAVAAIFRAATGLDRQQRGQLDILRIEVLAMHLLGAPEQVVVERRRRKIATSFKVGVSNLQLFFCRSDHRHVLHTEVGEQAEDRPAQAVRVRQTVRAEGGQRQDRAENVQHQVLQEKYEVGQQRQQARRRDER